MRSPHRHTARISATDARKLLAEARAIADLRRAFEVKVARLLGVERAAKILGRAPGER